MISLSGYKLRPVWMLRLRLIRYLVDEFEVGGFFYEWKSRITESHKREENDLVKRYADSTGAFPEEDEELIAEDHAEIARLTTSLFATLVVAMWARLEFFSKVLAECAESASGGTTRGPRRYKFHEIVASIKKSTGIDLEKASNFDIVNAIRIINNSYKHSDGTYDQNPQYEMDKISSTLLTNWALLDAQQRIEFDKLPYDEIFDCCRAFCDDVLAKIEQALHV